MTANRGPVALVTGSGSGIGAAVVDELATSCSMVFGLDVHDTVSESVTERFAAQGSRFIPLAADISDEDQVANVFGEIERQAGRLDIVATLAGVGSSGKVFRTEEMPLSEWNRLIRVNLTGTFLVCRAAIPLLKQSARGRIVTTTSQTARLATANTGGAYPASKAGVTMFTKVLALELAEFGITANVLAPGMTETSMTAWMDLEGYAQTIPLGRNGKPHDLAKAVAFLVSEDAGYITGVTLDVNGGRYMA